MAQGTVLSRLWNRDLNAYPKGAHRWGLLLLVVASGICLTSLGLVAGAIAPLLFKETGMSTSFYSYLFVVSGLISAATAYFSALSDRIGRANLLVYGALAAGLIATFGVPTAHTKWEFAIWYCTMGFADGIALVGTATLMRDYTPQTGRATAMGVNTLGAGVSSLLISFFASRLLTHTGDWRVMLHLTGGAALGAFVVTLFLLRELSPHLRAQVRVTPQDEYVIERTTSDAQDEQVIAQTRGWAKWRQVITPRLVAANLAIMFYLITFVTASGFLILYYVQVHHLSVAQANQLGTLYWAANCVGLVFFGVLSDRLMVRKPIMFLGAGIVVISMIFIMTADHPSYWQLAIPLIFWSVGMGGGFSPWYAAYSEESEAINPALVGTSFGVFGVFGRLSSVIAGLVIPHVIGSPMATTEGWQTWFIVCIILMILFVPLCAYGLGGFYSPRKAKAALLARSVAGRTQPEGQAGPSPATTA